MKFIFFVVGLGSLVCLGSCSVESRVADGGPTDAYGEDGGDAASDPGGDPGSDPGGDPFTPADDGGDSLPSTCTAGETRCVGPTYQVCSNGIFTESETCLDAQVCAVGLGCVDCDPSQGNTCVGDSVYSCNPDGTLGAHVMDCLTEVCVNGECGDPDCPPETQLIYVVDNEYRLLSFTPVGGLNQFTLIGELDCPASQSWPDWGTGTATPFSMSVDRDARAWVLYTSGEIFWVNTSSAYCEASPFTPGQGDYQLFGMGFVSDSTGSSSEKLYISGGPAGDLQSGNMGYIDPDTLQTHDLGQIPPADYSPELTGTGNARWFGYFPGTNNTFVAELSKQDGSIIEQWDLPPLGGQVRAWAFAHWGGKFYIFITTDFVNPNSQVLLLDPVTGNTDTLLENLPYIIVGAGVSTCAPFE